MSEAFLDLVDLACERCGGSVVAANDEFFAAKENLIKREPPIWIEDRYTERGKWMDGWETRRRRDVTDDSHDWCIVRLGAPGHVFGVNVDTANFKGNYPAACAIDVTDLAGVQGAQRPDRSRPARRPPPMANETATCPWQWRTGGQTTLP